MNVGLLALNKEIETQFVHEELITSQTNIIY